MAKNKRLVLTLVLIMAIGLTLTGCLGGDDESERPADVGSEVSESEPKINEGEFAEEFIEAYTNGASPAELISEIDPVVKSLSPETADVVVPALFKSQLKFMPTFQYFTDKTFPATVKRILQAEPDEKLLAEELDVELKTAVKAAYDNGFIVKMEDEKLYPQIDVTIYESKYLPSMSEGAAIDLNKQIKIFNERPYTQY